MSRLNELLTMDLEKIPQRTPGSCDKAIYNKGSSFAVTHTIRMWDVEAWVKAVGEISGQRVDWHYVGSRANILVLGDYEKARKAALDLVPLLRRMWRARLESKDSPCRPEDCPRVEIATIGGQSIMLEDPL